MESVKEIYGPVKEEEGRRIRKTSTQGHITGEDFVEFIKYLRLGWYDHVERMQNERMPKESATANMKGTRRSGRTWKRWREGWGRVKYGVKIEKNEIGGACNTYGGEEKSTQGFAGKT